MNIHGDKIILRAIEAEDLEQLRETINDPEMEKLVVGWSFPISKNNQMEWYNNLKSSNTDFRFAIEYNMEFVGLATLTNIDWKSRCAFHGIKLIKSAPKGKGLGFDSVYAIMKYAFEELQLNRLEGGILEYNIPSMKLYSKCGWKREGVFKQKVFKNNKYHDEYPVAILKEEYFTWKLSNNLNHE